LTEKRRDLNQLSQAYHRWFLPKQQQNRLSTGFSRATGSENQWPGIRRTDVDVIPRGSQFIDYDVPCDVLTTNGAILRHRQSAIRAHARMDITRCQGDRTTVLMGGYFAGVAKNIRLGNKPQSPRTTEYTTFLRPKES
jgi:hypothetical protein